MGKADFNHPEQGTQPVHEEAALSYYHGDPAADPKKRERVARLMAIQGVEGVGTGQDGIGEPNLVVYVRDAEAAKRIPQDVDGMKVQIEITGPIQALKL